MDKAVAPTEWAEILRNAARLMEERAKAAGPGPWRAHTTYPHTVWQGSEDDPYIVSTTLCREPAADAVHIASWHPPVARAVADWLEDEAVRIDDTPYRVDADWIERNYRAPLAVARAYLGSQP